MQEALDDLRETEEDLMSTRHDLIQKEYEDELDQLQVWADTMQDFIDLTEEQAHIVDRQYYDELITNTTEKIKLLQEEADNLMADMYYAALNGLAEGSEEWNEMAAGIADVDSQIREATKDLVTFNNEIRQLEWDAFDRLSDAIDNFNDEIEFAYDLLDEERMWDDYGHITEEGIAGLGILASSYDTLMRKAQEYGKQLEKVNAELAADPNNTEIIDRQRELASAQQDAITSANQQKESIKDLINNGFDKEIDAIENLIDEYEQLLDDQQDQHSYAQEIASQQKTINNLQKQVMAWAGDDSEEGRANSQKAQEQLRQAQQALEESQADRRVSEIKETLSNLTSDLQETFDRCLQDTDALIVSVIDALNTGTITQELGEGGTLNTSILWNGQQIAAGFENYLGENSSLTKLQGVISNTISEAFTSVGYTPSETMSAFLQSALSDAGNLVTGFKSVFNDPDAKILQAINKVSTDVYSMTDAGKAEAAAKIAAEKKRQEEAAAKAKAAAAAAQAKKQAEAAKANASTSAASNFTDADLKKIAAAIWIYNGSGSGWGDDPQRSQRLTQKLGAAKAKKVQNYLNTMGPNGQLYNAYWSQRNTLSKYFYGAFASGTKKVMEDQLAWTQENAPEMIVRKSDGAVLTKLNHGDTVFNGSATSTLFAFGNDPAKFLQSFMPTLPTVTSGGNTSNFDISINVPNVTNYKEFLSAMQNDKQFTSLVQELTLGAASGHNSLKKHSITIR